MSRNNVHRFTEQVINILLNLISTNVGQQIQIVAECQTDLNLKFQFLCSQYVTYALMASLLKTTQNGICELARGNLCFVIEYFE